MGVSSLYNKLVYRTATNDSDGPKLNPKLTQVRSAGQDEEVFPC